MFHPQNGYFSLVFSQAAQKPRPRPTTSSALNTKVKAPGMGYFWGKWVKWASFITIGHH